ncbi:hypothetical protein BBJ28_00017764 [Nothophytophthora sp. Chile5]|nr:hypothetical protein BBJ28_00017764 [Nothophytophthora sp. Chile5]
MARMLEQMAVEKERHAAKAQQALADTKQHVNLAKQKLAKVEGKHQQQKQVEGGGEAGSSPYDWTRTYEKWDAWEDPEELARQEQAARERSERAAKAQMGCNHDHSAVHDDSILAGIGVWEAENEACGEECALMSQKLMDMSTQEKLTACDEFRVLGNLFFRHGQYQRAAYNYHKALVYFEYVFPDTEDEEAQADALKLKLLLNFAACRLKTLHLDDAVHHANQALQLDPDNVKALYRRAQAHRLKDEFELASQDISRALELSGTSEDAQTADPLLVQEKALLQAKILAYKLRTKQVSTAMFGGKSSISRPITAKYVPGLRAPDASAMTLDLSKSSRVGSLAMDNGASLDSWQPSTRGASALQTLLTQLEG